MKVTLSVHVNDNCHMTAEHTIESSDMHGLMEDLEKAVELRKLRSLKHKVDTENLKKALAEDPPMPIQVIEEQDFGPHEKVFEYDGAFRCLRCHSAWGALPGKPKMPDLCTTNDHFHL